MTRQAAGAGGVPGDPPAPTHVTLHIWRVPARRLGRALWRMVRDRGRVAGLPGVRFAKLLGTGRGGAFGPLRADITRWAALLVWTDARAAAAFDSTGPARAWRVLADGYCRIDLHPLTARGTWAGRRPFGPNPTAEPRAAGLDEPAGPDRPNLGPVLALTRARLRPSRAATFWRAIAPVATASTTAPGLLAAFGVGEAPIGWQGTVSVWRTARELVDFAYREPRHRRVIDQTPRQRWYAEELFARFAVLSITGDREVIGWTDERTPRDMMGTSPAISHDGRQHRTDEDGRDRR